MSFQRVVREFTSLRGHCMSDSVVIAHVLLVFIGDSAVQSSTRTVQNLFTMITTLCKTTKPIR